MKLRTKTTKRYFFRQTRFNFVFKTYAQNQKKTEMLKKEENKISEKAEDLEKASDQSFEKSVSKLKKMIETKDFSDITNLDKPLDLHTTDQSLLTKDVLKNKDSYLNPSSKENDLTMNTSNSLRIKNNKVVKEILQTGQLDIMNKDISFQSMNVQDTSLINSKDTPIAQANLGEVQVLPKNSVSVEDIDPDNIPANQDVIIEPLKKEAILFGVETTKIHSKEEREKNLQKVSQNMFEERSFDEVLRENTYFIDGIIREESFGNYLSRFLRYLPLAFFGICFFYNFLELNRIRMQSYKLEQQELEQLRRLKSVKEGAYEYQLEKKNSKKDLKRKLVFEEI